MKTKFIKLFLKIAKETAELSYATRAKVGCVVFKETRLLSSGYNGTPSGYCNSCENTYTDNLGNNYTKTKPEVIHAELNAIAFMAKDGISSNGCSVLLTLSPCFECSKLIIASGIKEVYFLNLYKDVQPLKFLQECGVQVFRIDEEGNTKQWDGLQDQQY